MSNELKLSKKERHEIEMRHKEKAARIALAILGIGVAAGATVVIGLNSIMKKVFVNESWPDEEWSNDDWAEEDLEN